MTSNDGDLARLIAGTLDTETSSRDLADAAQYSVAQTYRRFDRPMRTRRRLLIERAAWQLTHGSRAVTEIAFDADFDSLEGFSRAFRTAFGVSPRAFRQLAPSDHRLGLGGLHFFPGESSLSSRQGELSMALLDLLLDDHKQTMHRLLDKYAGLPEERRSDVIHDANAFPWLPDDMTLAELVQRSSGFGEPWISMLDDEPATSSDGSPDSLRKQLDENHRRFLNLAQRVEKENSWDLTFVDQYCDPPQVFSYGSIVNMQIVYSSHLRVTLEIYMRKQGEPVTFE